MHIIIFFGNSVKKKTRVLSATEHMIWNPCVKMISGVFFQHHITTPREK